MLHRLLPALACALAAGIACADALRPDVGLLLAGGGIAAALGVASRRPAARAAAALALCALAGALSLALRFETAAVGADALPAERSVEAVVESTRLGVRGLRLVLGGVRAVDGGAAPVPARLLWLADPGRRELEALAPGSALRARLRLRAWRPLRNPGRPATEQVHARAGIGAVATLAEPSLWVRVPEADRWSVAGGLHPLRRRAADRLRALGPGGGLLCALGLGERAGLAPEIEDAFARLGLVHLLSVSGLHLVLAAGLAYAIALFALRRLPALTARRDARAAALLAALGAASVYALLAGFEVPVQRSLMLVIASGVALAARRPERAYHPLAAAALCVLAAAPEALFDAGAQLSFAACAGLIAAAQRAPVPVAGLRGRLASLLRSTAAASAVSAPLAAWHGLPAAPLALASNALAVPWTGVALLPVSLAASALAALPASPLADLALHGAERLAAASLAAVAPPPCPRRSRPARPARRRWRSRSRRGSASPRAARAGRCGRALRRSPARRCSPSRRRARCCPNGRASPRSTSAPAMRCWWRRAARACWWMRDPRWPGVSTAAAMRCCRRCARSACGASICWSRVTRTSTTAGGCRRCCASCRSARSGCPPAAAPTPASPRCARRRGRPG